MRPWIGIRRNKRTKQPLFIEVGGPPLFKEFAVPFGGVDVWPSGQQKSGIPPTRALPWSPKAVHDLQTLYETHTGQSVTIYAEVVEWLNNQYAVRDRIEEANRVPAREDYYQHQAAAAERVRVIPFQILSDQVGTGKTVSACAVIEDQYNRLGRRPFRVLVITPNAVKPQFAEEIERWTSLPGIVLDGNRDERLQIVEELPERAVLIANWGALPYYADALYSHEWDVIVADECHYAKNRDATRTQVLTGVPDRKNNNRQNWPGLDAPIKLMLSGTPIEKTGADLWPLMYWWRPHQYSSYWRTAGMWAEVYAGQWGGAEVRGIRNLDIFQDELMPIMRRVELDDITDMPPQVIIPVWIDLHSKHMEMYRNVQASLSVTNPLAALATLRQLTLSPKHLGAEVEFPLHKLDWLDEKLTELAHDQALVFFEFRGPLETTFKALEDVGTMTTYHGDVDEDTRNRRRLGIKAGRISKGLFTYKAGGAGLDFPDIKYTIMAEPCLSGTEFTQALGRTRRVTSTHKQVVFVPLAKNTVDERIWKYILEPKRNLSKEALERFAIKAIQEEDA